MKSQNISNITNIHNLNNANILKQIFPNLIYKKYLGNKNNNNVYLMEKNNQQIICKEISNKEIQMIKIEYLLYSLLSKYNICKKYINPCIEYKTINDKIYVLQPYFAGYNIHNLQNQYLSKIAYIKQVELLEYIFKHILEAMASIHARGITHRNINPDTIIIKPNLNEIYKTEIKLTDFTFGCDEDKIKCIHMPKNYNRNFDFFTKLNTLYKTEDDFKLSKYIDVWTTGLLLLKLINPSLDTSIYNYNEFNEVLPTEKKEINYVNCHYPELEIYNLQIYKRMLVPYVDYRPFNFILNKILIHKKYINDQNNY